MLFFRRKKDEGLEQKKQEILSKIKPVFCKMLEVGEEKVVPNARIVEDLGADSLDSVDITIKLEEAFNIEISDEDVEKMKTIDDVLSYLARYADEHR
ncbi:MAG: acyl carrier protein [Candidatus Omnitrophota bacterium]|nr:acyl carrier protein [Candidatus Omnitrophota bacterium]